MTTFYHFKLTLITIFSVHSSAIGWPWFKLRQCLIKWSSYINIKQANVEISCKLHHLFNYTLVLMKRKRTFSRTYLFHIQHVTMWFLLDFIPKRHSNAYFVWFELRHIRLVANENRFTDDKFWLSAGWFTCDFVQNIERNLNRLNSQWNISQNRSV